MSEILVSACLLGRPCRYDGAAKPSSAVRDFVERFEQAGQRVVPVCPEELGGLGTPRPAAELRGGSGAQVLDGTATVARLDDGMDLREAFILGAERAAERAPGAAMAVLKARSPSCGCRSTHIDGGVQAGMGVFAALLARKGVELWSDEEI
jgi:uncharacterized protein YbbK (DUF523 family)